MSNDQPKVACEYGAMGRHTWQRTADNTDICINCKRYRSVVPPTSAPKVEPVADSPASAADDPVVAAQHDETGRMWWGLRSNIPERYAERYVATHIAFDAAKVEPVADSPDSAGDEGARVWADELATQIAAQCWCDPTTSKIEMDSRLAEVFASNLSRWLQSYAQESRNVAYYQGLIDKCGQQIGIAAYTADDGGVHDTVLRAKVPALIERLAADLATMTAERNDAFARALEFRLTELDAVRAERNAALARAEAAEPDALRWRECVGHADGTGCGFPAGHRGEWLVVSRPDGQIITGATPNETVDAAIAKGAP